MRRRACCPASCKTRSASPRCAAGSSRRRFTIPDIKSFTRPCSPCWMRTSPWRSSPSRMHCVSERNSISSAVRRRLLNSAVMLLCQRITRTTCKSCVRSGCCAAPSMPARKALRSALIMARTNRMPMPWPSSAVPRAACLTACRPCRPAANTAPGRCLLHKESRTGWNAPEPPSPIAARSWASRPACWSWTRPCMASMTRRARSSSSQAAQGRGRRPWPPRSSTIWPCCAASPASSSARR